MRISTAGFGPWIADGVTDCSSTLSSVLSSLSTSSDKILELDHNGTVVYAASNSNAYTVPAGVSIVGRGPNTILQTKAGSIGNTGNWSLFVLSNNCVVKNLTIDGNSANQTPTGAVGNTAIFIGSGVTNVTIDTVEIHHIANNGGESFGIECSGSDNRIRNVHAHHINGSGISVNGSATVNASAPYVTGYGTVGVQVEGCDCHDNVWQGVTFYFVSKCTLNGGTFYNNSKRNVNTEWSEGCNFIGFESYGAQFAGFGTYGICTDLSLVGAVIKGNVQAAGNTHLGEIDFQAGTSGGNRGIIQNARISGCTVVAGGGVCLSVAERDTTVNLGPSVATSIVISGPDIETWTYGVPNSPFNNKYVPCGLFYKGLETVAGLASNHPSAWTLTNFTVSAAPAGALSTNTAKTMTQTVANTATSAVSASLLTKGGRYLLSYGFKVIDANAVWEFSTNSQISQIRLPQNASDLGTWVRGQIIVTVPPNFADNFMQIVEISGTASASALGVDFVEAMRVEYLGSASGS